MKFIIRKAMLSDAINLAKLYFQFWESHRKVDPLLEFEKKLTLENQTKVARKNIKKKNNFIFVAVKDRKIIGFIEFLIKKNESGFKVKKYGYLNLATTHKDYRRKGIAKALTKACLGFLKKKRIKYVKTNVYNVNEVAMKTWIKQGFKPQSAFLIKELK